MQESADSVFFDANDSVPEKKEDKKRGPEVLSPPVSDIKKTKMVANGKEDDTPKWVKNLATVQDIERISKQTMDKFINDCFEPFKVQVLGRVEKLEKDHSVYKETLAKQKVDIERDFNNAYGEMEKSIKSVEDDLVSVRQDNSMLIARVNQLFDIVKEERSERNSLKHKVTDIEDRQRLDNLVIDGLTDEQGEKPDKTAQKTRDFFKDTLKLNNPQNIVMGRCHRLGAFEAGKDRQTIVKFDLYKQRQRVFEERIKLPTDSDHKVKQNYSHATEQARVQLYPFMKVARKLDYYAKLEGGRLTIRSRDKNINISVSLDTLEKLPEDINPAKIFTPCKNDVTLFYTYHSPPFQFS